MDLSGCPIFRFLAHISCFLTGRGKTRFALPAWTAAHGEGSGGREVLPGGAGPGVELCRLSRAFPVPRFNRVFKMPGGACGVAQKRGVTHAE